MLSSLLKLNSSEVLAEFTLLVVYSVVESNDIAFLTKTGKSYLSIMPLEKGSAEETRSGSLTWPWYLGIFRLLTLNSTFLPEVSLLSP